MTRAKCTGFTQKLHLYHRDTYGNSKCKVAEFLECPVIKECFLGPETVRKPKKECLLFNEWFCLQGENVLYICQYFDILLSHTKHFYTCHFLGICLRYYHQ